MYKLKKVTAQHLKRHAYLYVRQSTMRQVVENTESTKRQYALQEKALALGWSKENIVVIDQDLGQSGASVSSREGFQYLVTEVTLGRAGIVLGIEVSRLARNNADWHKLLEICAFNDTLILDEDGIYHPGDFNDRLLLGLKGTMSEAELHLIRKRLWGGVLNKAHRGELTYLLPVGFVYDEQKRVVLDPDKAVQNAIRHMFVTFRRTGSAGKTAIDFYKRKLDFPIHIEDGKAVWGQLNRDRVVSILHHPRYAGAFVYGRTRDHRTVQGRKIVKNLPREEWISLIRDAHPGYITWEEYEENLQILTKNNKKTGMESGPVREGSALLQGIAICGICGCRMCVHYTRKGSPHYICIKNKNGPTSSCCHNIRGVEIDEAIGQLLLDTMTPNALDVAMQVEQKLRSRTDEVKRLYREHVDRAKYEESLAKRRYMQVDPENRLVADELENEWNSKLLALSKAQEDYENRCAEQDRNFSKKQKREIMDLAKDFPRLWKDERIPHRERKRIVRLLIEDVTLLKTDKIAAHVRFKGGKTHSFFLPLPQPCWLKFQTPPEVIKEIDCLLDQYTEYEIPELLNDRGFKTGKGLSFNFHDVRYIRSRYKLKPQSKTHRLWIYNQGENVPNIRRQTRNNPKMEKAGPLEIRAKGEWYNVPF